MKKNDILLFVGKWIEIEKNTLSEAIQTIFMYLLEHKQRKSTQNLRLKYILCSS